MLTGLQRVQQAFAGRGVMGLPRCQFEAERQAILVRKCMNFCA